MNALPMRHYCTYFDSNYLLRGLLLYQSLRRHVRHFTLSVLCLDNAAAEALRPLQSPHLRLVTLAELECAEPRLPAVRPQRSRIEYYFTLTPAWIRHALQFVAHGATMTYLDADLYCFADPLAADTEMGNADVLLVPHRFPPGSEARERAGIFNVGYLSFRRTAVGMAALDWWTEACLEWCGDTFDGERYADQGYLNQLPRRFDSVHICAHHGINAAPWNIARYHVTAGDGRYLLDGTPLLVYHFHGLRPLTSCLFDSGLPHYGVEPSPALLQLYGEYLQALQRLRRRRHTIGGPRGLRRPGPRQLVSILSTRPVLSVSRRSAAVADLRRCLRVLQGIPAFLFGGS